MKEDAFGFDLPIVCQHCDPCNALNNCPEEALERKEGQISVDEEKCIGCGICLETCTLGSVKLHPERKTPLICDQCNGTPSCVEKCPTKALTYIETETLQPKSPSQARKETLRRWGMVA